MSHDKISAAARRRMTDTGEPYAAAQRAVIREHQAGAGTGDGDGAAPEPRWFAISYRERGLDRMNHLASRTPVCAKAPLSACGPRQRRSMSPWALLPVTDRADSPSRGDARP